MDFPFAASDQFAHTSDNLFKGSPTYLGNGNLGLQSSPTGLSPSRSFLAGIVDLTPIDIVRPALLPEWSSTNILLNGTPIDCALELIDPESYRQTLHMDIGVLATHFTVTSTRSSWQIEILQFVARHIPGIAFNQINIEAVDGGDVGVEFGIRQNVQPPRFPFRTSNEVPPGFGGGFHEARMTFRWHPGHMDIVSESLDADSAVIGITAAAAGNGPAVGIATSMWSDHQMQWQIQSVASGPVLKSSTTLSSGQTLSLNRVTAFTRDDHVARLCEQAVTLALGVRTAGIEPLLSDHCHAWSVLWDRDIIIEGSERLQKQARTDLFYLMSSRSADKRWSMPIFGIASSGYNGGIFWDADVFMFPALLPLLPDFARGMVDFRHRTLPAALKRAYTAGLSGAKYAWESELLAGEENIAPVDSILGAQQIHNNAGIALAQWHYYCGTGDLTWLRSYGFPVIAEVAEFWVNRVTYNEELDRYELLNVYSVEESDGMVDNCAYTNAAAARSLMVACLAAGALGFPIDSSWADISSKMYIPLQATTGFHKANDSANGPTLWSSTLMFYPLEWPGAEGEKEDCLLEPYFWDMSLQPIVAAMCGNSRKMREYLDVQSTRFVHAPFGVRGEQADNDAVPMHTGCGCFLQALIYGATGLRWRSSGLEPIYQPCLPEGITSITFRRLIWQDNDFSVIVNAKGLSVSARGKLPLS